MWSSYQNRGKEKRRKYTGTGVWIEGICNEVEELTLCIHESVWIEGICNEVQELTLCIHETLT
jgi:murein L,D-transpeptidase YafK